MENEITYEEIMSGFMNDIEGLTISYNEGTETVRFTSKYQDCISDLNQYLLDCYPHYLSNISYDVNDRDGKYWLKLICIRREVA